jgi:hypothetical protein
MSARGHLGTLAKGFWWGAAVDLIVLVSYVARRSDAEERATGTDTGETLASLLWLVVMVGVPAVALVSAIVFIVSGSRRRLGLGIVIGLAAGLPIALLAATIAS